MHMNVVIIIIIYYIIIIWKTYMYNTIYIMQKDYTKTNSKSIRGMSVTIIGF